MLAGAIADLIAHRLAAAARRCEGECADYARGALDAEAERARVALLPAGWDLEYDDSDGPLFGRLTLIVDEHERPVWRG